MTDKKLKPEQLSYPMLGCDPEFFFKNEQGFVIGAEKILPKDGLAHTGGYGKIIIDGVQGELNPAPNTCRDIVASGIRECFLLLDKQLKEKGSKVTCDFKRTAKISKDNLAALKKESRQFGCDPSYSIYPTKTKLKAVDGEKYRVRAAGGHIHLGINGDVKLREALHKDYKRTVYMLDILIGNTSVLVDRDKGNIERRKLYGKAGEYRLPKHGLEYRTLSNYWLHCKPLMSFAMGMARLAVSLMSSPDADEYYKAFTSTVKRVDIYKAINKNDFHLALANFKKIEELIMQVAHVEYGRTPLNKSNMQEFHHFVKQVKAYGIDHYFKVEPMKHWIDANQVPIKDNYWVGFNEFLTSVVRAEMKAEAKELAKAEAEAQSMLMAA